MSPNETFQLEIVDQPERARCCGFGSYDFRSINPTPIIKLRSFPNHHTFDSQFLVTATLYSVDPKNQNKPQKELLNNLIGTTVAESRILKGLNDSDGVFFVFPQLYIRKAGTYRLLFKLLRIFGPDSTHMLPESTVVDMVFSEPLLAYAPRYFPGKSKSTMLMKFLAKQTHDLKSRTL
ncbi:velvet factor [Globomyces pollinis-pini]|nr:velvet factor [Globomyces pollinis-pini]